MLSGGGIVGASWAGSGLDFTMLVVPFQLEVFYESIFSYNKSTKVQLRKEEVAKSSPQRTGFFFFLFLLSSFDPDFPQQQEHQRNQQPTTHPPRFLHGSLTLPAIGMGPGVGVAIVGCQVWEHAVQDSGILWNTNHPALEKEKGNSVCSLWTYPLATVSATLLWQRLAFSFGLTLKTWGYYMLRVTQVFSSYALCT